MFLSSVTHKMEPLQFGTIILCFLFLSSDSVSGYDEFEKACVVAHNNLRQVHGSQAVVWSEELGDDAQAWCEELALRDVLEHDNKTMDTKNQGENLAAVVVVDPSSEGPGPEACAMAVEEWYAEETNYNYQTGMPNSPGLPIKHFAQVVWNSTFELGIGSARSTQHGDIICARYSPRGAEGGPVKFKENVKAKQAGVRDLAFKLNNCTITNPIAKLGKGFTLKTRPCINGYNGGGGGGGGKSYDGSMSCGVGKKSRIVGGEDARPSEYPWQVGFRTEGNGWRTNIFCGGSLVNKNWVVTAAHCFQRPPEPQSVTKVLLGEFDVNNEEGNEVAITVEKVINHPQYNPRSMDNDITMIKLESPVQFNENMKPVCLPDASINFPPGKMCTVTGFGTIREGGPQTTKLQKVDVPIIDSKKCGQSYGRPISDKKVCAGYDEGQKDSCQGDSGGPLVCQKGGKYYLTGVVSYGSGCARPNAPGVYANVKNLMPWVQSTMDSN